MFSTKLNILKNKKVRNFIILQTLYNGIFAILTLFVNTFLMKAYGTSSKEVIIYVIVQSIVQPIAMITSFSLTRKKGHLFTQRMGFVFYAIVLTVLCVFGEKGMVRLGGMNASTVDVWTFTHEDEADENRRFIEEKAPNVYGNGHTSLFLDFANAVKEKRQPYVDLYAGKRAVEMILSIYKSQKTGEKVTFPLTDFASSDMK
jgi:hypothetical protein